MEQRRRLFHKIKRKYERFCPYGEKRLKQMALEDIRSIILFSVLSSFVLIVWNLNFKGSSILYVTGSIFLAVGIIVTEVPGYSLKKAENRFYKEYIRYLACVKHHYIRERNIPNAIYDAAEEYGEEVRLHAALLHQILSGANRKEPVRDYVLFTDYNRYLKLFLVQAYEASEKGDIQEGKKEESLFSENVEHLRTEVMEELYRREKRNYSFAGYAFVSSVPVFSMPLLRSWGLEFSPDLAAFYQGWGRCLEILTLMATWGIYQFISEARELSALFLKQEDTMGKIWKWKALKRIVEYFEQQNNRMSRKIREWLLFSNAKDTYGSFIVRSIGYVMVALIFCFLTVCSVAEDGRLQLTVVKVVLGMICSLFAGCIPMIGILYRKKLLEQEVETEIRQFQTVIIMERKLSMITIPELLEDMEIFSRLFRRVLRECINSYASGADKALRKLKEEGKKIHGEFESIADGFLAVDGVGIQKAFAEVGRDREMLEKMTHLETEIQMARKKDSMDLLSKIPMILTVGCYFIVPFFIVSLQGVFMVFEVLEELRM